MIPEAGISCSLLALSIAATITATKAALQICKTAETRETIDKFAIATYDDILIDMIARYVFVLLAALVWGCYAQVYTGRSTSSVVEAVEPAAPAAPVKNEFVTQTVYGFLDFTTTIGNTIMVFSPQSAPAEGSQDKDQKSPPIQTKPKETPKNNLDIQPSKTVPQDNKKPQTKGTKVVVHSVVEKNVVKHSEDNVVPIRNENVKTRIEVVTKSPVLSSVVEVRPKDETPIKNNLAEPEYDFLSKQPAEVIDETYKLINLRPSSKAHAKPRPTTKRDKENPTGLVTRLGGTIVKDGLTTVHETNVIGTYINGKYAQVLQSNSRVLTPSAPEVKIRPTNSQRILKTIGPQHGKLKPQLEPTPVAHQDESSLPLEVLFSSPSGPNVKTTRRHSNNHQARPKFRSKVNEEDNTEPHQQPRSIGKNRPTTARPSYKNRNQQTTTTEPPTTRRRSGFRPSNPPGPTAKLGRWSYKTTPKPRIEIRKQVDDEERTFSPEVSTQEVIIEEKSTPVIQRKITEESSNEDELDPSESEDVDASIREPPQQILPVETINVEISTAPDLNDIYFEIATIKSPYTFQVGTMRNTRYVTVTSTQKKSFNTVHPSTPISPSEPLTENILANTGAAYETTLPLDSSVATLPAISLDPGQATPPLETLVETFSTTQTLLKTYLLPVISNGNTTKLTLVQTYNIARVVTATKTLPPMEIYQFIPSKTLNEFNSKLDEAGSELHLELDFSDDDRDDEDIPKRVVAPSELESDLNPFKSASQSRNKPEPPTTPSPEPQLSPEQAQQLALLKYFGQPQPQVITTSRPVVVMETVYESHVIPIVNGGNTMLSTLSRPVGTVPRTSYEYGTSTIAPILPPAPPIFPQQHPQFTVTSAPLITQTFATVSDSRVLKLTFGAKTAYTTLFSTRVIPTELTTYVTSTVPVQPTVPAFPGYFPPPVGYPPFPYVG
ncbi:uncharacterized protein LOC107268564 isoform X1 [Cephus cinctus]|uniref:Uncharacterized protein LOC107268564 isoform X1 n=1 Tax=Cephus cinctus TaxID=211228 RepID=A0AAJ7RIM7_CEPCN|nr:uncharacterized protein LOC107268564 isoform X1 [Cephus cinctus]